MNTAPGSRVGLFQFQCVLLHLKESWHHRLGDGGGEGPLRRHPPDEGHLHDPVEAAAVVQRAGQVEPGLHRLRVEVPSQKSR